MDKAGQQGKHQGAATQILWCHQHPGGNKASIQQRILHAPLQQADALTAQAAAKGAVRHSGLMQQPREMIDLIAGKLYLPNQEARGFLSRQVATLQACRFDRCRFAGPVLPGELIRLGVRPGSRCLAGAAHREQADKKMVASRQMGHAVSVFCLGPLILSRTKCYHHQLLPRYALTNSGNTQSQRHVAAPTRLSVQIALPGLPLPCLVVLTVASLRSAVARLFCCKVQPWLLFLAPAFFI